mgnify:CR=1 FL=1
MTTELTKENFSEYVLESKEPVLVDFWAAWCGPCRMLAPVIEELSEEYKTGKVNIDEQEELAEEYGIEVIPTVLAFKDGKCCGKSTGFVPKEKIAALLEDAE